MCSLRLVNQSQTTYCDEKFLDVHGIRLTPPFLEFTQAYEGKTYNKQLSIQNIGKSPVVVRITPPSSYAFKIKPLKAYKLSPGLTLVRNVTYVYSYANSPSCIVPIYINEHRFDYYIIAATSTAEVEVTPKCIDFGSIDMGYTSPAHTLILKNTGTRPVKFCINNFTCDDYTLIIEPFKGLLQAKTTTAVSLKLLANIQGFMHKEMWIKTEKPTKVSIQAEVIKPQFELISSCSSSPFNLIDFPVTYVGLTSTQSKYVRNFSASTSMFCIMGEVNHKISPVDVCRETQHDYQYFTGYPLFGMFQAMQINAINFRFHPQKPKRGAKLVPYYFCIFRVCRIRAKFLKEEDYQELFSSDTSSAVTYSRFSLTASMTNHQQSELDYASLIASSIAIEQPQYNVIRPSDEFACVKFYLHGIPEIPNVTVIPDELILCDLVPRERVARVLQFNNLSKKLPIIVVYNKIAFIDLSEAIIEIAPLGSVQVSVFITPQNIGTIQSKMSFDLVYYDLPRDEREPYKVIGNLKVPIKFSVNSITKAPGPEINFGITPNYIKEPGKFCENLRFRDNYIEKPKAAVLANHLIKNNSMAVIALPNDTQKSVRPWRSQYKCKTIFKKMARYVAPLDTDYEKAVLEEEFKTKMSAYYTTFTRNWAERARLALKCIPQTKEYDITTGRKRLCNDFKLPSARQAKVSDNISLTQYLPLLIHPVQIANIIVTPEVVHTGMISTHHKCEFTIHIRNNNHITISVHVRCDKPNVLFPVGQNILIKGYSEMDLLGIYISGQVGFYTAEVKLIINECAYIMVDIHANVCPVTLNLDRNVIVFEGQQVNQHVQIINTLVSDAVFKWTLTCNNFSIDPDEGVVRSNSSLLCNVRYFPDVEDASSADLYLTCTDKIVDQLKLRIKSAEARLFFLSNKLNFPNIPLNIPVIKTVLLENNSNTPQCYKYVSEEFSGIIDIFPTKGVVQPHSFCVLTLIVTMKTCVKFEAKLKFAILRNGFINLNVNGNVVYPDVQISPSVLNFKKIPCSTSDVLKITVENRSVAEVSVTFDLSMYPEYIITKTNRLTDTTPVQTITMERCTILHLYIHFKPYAVSCDNFYLPAIINGIIATVPNTRNSKEGCNLLTNNIPCSRSQNTPPQPPLVAVRSYAVEAKVSISKTNILLKYAPFQKKYKSSYNLRLANSQNKPERVCIRTDDLKRPLYLTQLSGSPAIHYPYSIVCRLEPHAEVIFEVSFRPYKYGKFSAVLPIFLKSDFSKRPHNHLFIQAEYEIPTIVCNHPKIYFKPLPLKIYAIGICKFTLRNHFDNCNIYCSCSLLNVELSISDRIKVDRNTQEISIRTLYFSEDRINQAVPISINCSCGGTCTVKIQLTAENCFLTNYALVHRFVMNPEYNLENRRFTSVDTIRRSSLVSISEEPQETIEEYNLSQFFKSYPYFPDIDDGGEAFFEFMERSVTIMESWISTQAFFGTVYYRIPGGISYIREDGPPFIQLLLNVAGDDVKRCLETGTSTTFVDQNLNLILKRYDTYKKVIAFLTELGARFTCIHPAYLLPFEMYKLYVKNIASQLGDEDLLIVEKPSQFHRLSKQCWLDTILQTYKVLVLNKVVRPLEELPAAYEMPHTPHQRYRQAVKNIVKNNHLFSTTELLLLDWLEFHFNNAVDTYWPGNVNICEREISHFGEVFDDGYVYAAITLTFCPYLKDHFEKLSVEHFGREDMLHNNMRVIQSWDILNLNVDVTVADLITPHPLKTLLITAYLFEVLPYFYPSESLEMKAGLSTKTQHVVVLANTNHFEVAYKAKLYGNEDNCFDICRDFYVIPPRSKCQIKITYWAKVVKNTQATLILSGECQGYRFARAKVITVCGIPDITYVTASYTFSCEMYNLTEQIMSIKSPYSVAATYRIMPTTKLCKTANDIAEKHFRDELPEFCIARCVPLYSTMTCNNEGDGELVVCFCVLTPAIITTWLYFRNEDAGDFGIKIESTVSPLLREEVLQVELPNSFNDMQDESKVLDAFLNIPCQNRLLWRGIIDMLLKFAVTDIEFWKKVLYTTAGVHVLRRLLWLIDGSVSDYVKMCEPATFKIKRSRDSNIILPKTVHIEDRCCMGTVKIPIRFLDPTYRGNFSIVLTSEDEIEQRQYRIYVGEESISGNTNFQAEDCPARK